ESNSLRSGRFPKSVRSEEHTFGGTKGIHSAPTAGGRARRAEICRSLKTRFHRLAHRTRFCGIQVYLKCFKHPREFHSIKWQWIYALLPTSGSGEGSPEVVLRSDRQIVTDPVKFARWERIGGDANIGKTPQPLQLFADGGASSLDGAYVRNVVFTG